MIIDSIDSLTTDSPANPVKGILGKIIKVWKLKLTDDMMWRREFETLTSDEMSMLIGIVQKSVKLPIDISPQILLYYKRDFVKQQVSAFRAEIKEEFLTIYDSLSNKLGVEQAVVKVEEKSEAPV